MFVSVVITVFIFSFKVSISVLLLAGNELLYRNRDGDVVRLNVDTDEKTILVHNKKFVSLFVIFSFLSASSQSPD